MRWPSRTLLACLVLALAAPGPAAAADLIEATSSVSSPDDPGFEGMYKYTLVVRWSFESHDLGHLDVFLDLAAFDDTCHADAVRFPVPAGTSEGEDMFGQPCSPSYRGEFLCKTDPSLKILSVGTTVKFEPIEQGCYTGQVGEGTFTFYSSVPPSPAGLHPDAVAIKHGQEVDFGGVMGPLPSGGGAGPAPVVINEFLVLPFGDAREFVELFDKTGGGIDLEGWSLEVWDRDSIWVSLTTFGPEDSLLPGGFLAEPADSFSVYCTECIGAPGDLRPAGAQAVGPDILFDAGGTIFLKDPFGTVVDQVSYGNAGGAPISCPIVVPAGYPRPPGFGGPPAPAPLPLRPLAAVADTAETLSTSTNRFPDGADTDSDNLDFSVGSPTPSSANVATSPDLGSSTRINSVYVWPSNADQDPANESVELYNPTGETKDVRGYHISDGYLIQPLFPPGGPIPLEPAQKLRVFHGMNGVISFEFEEEDRMDLYEPRATGLVRVDQLGWSRLPSFFPDSCFTRVPDGVGPSGGWNWDTSGGFINLFYVEGCALESPNVEADAAVARTALAAPWPNPARGPVRFEFTVAGGAAAGTTASVGVYDVAGRRVRVIGEATYPAGRHVVTWDGRADGGRPAPAGVYFARLLVDGQAAGGSRMVVRLRD